jgi:phage host-nuclease inhibitor protein Gam
MAGKKKSETRALLGTLEAADAALAELGSCERIAAAARAELDERMAALKTEYGATLSPPLLRARDLRELLEASAAAHPEWFGKARSVALPHGRMAWRWVTSIKLPKSLDRLIAALRSRGLRDAVIVRETVNKEILASYVDDLLEELGVKRQGADEFRIELAEVPDPKPEPSK